MLNLQLYPSFIDGYNQNDNILLQKCTIVTVYLAFIEW